MPIANSFIVITGAASGIGRALCLAFIKNPSTCIYAIDKNIDGLAELQILFKEHKRDEFYTSAVDLSNAMEIENVSKLILEKINKRKLILINNAGANLISGFLKDTPIEGFEWIMNTNFWSMVRLTQHLLPYLISQNQGHIVNISSVFGLFSPKTNVPYATTKFAVRGYSEGLRAELSNTHIELTCVHPGGVQTAICANSKVLGDAVNAQTKDKLTRLFAKQARTSPENAAKEIISAIEHKKHRLLIGVDAKFIDIIIRLFPLRHQKIFTLISKALINNSLDKLDEVY